MPTIIEIIDKKNALSRKAQKYYRNMELHYPGMEVYLSRQGSDYSTEAYCALTIAIWYREFTLQDLHIDNIVNFFTTNRFLTQAEADRLPGERIICYLVNAQFKPELDIFIQELQELDEMIKNIRITPRSAEIDFRVLLERHKEFLIGEYDLSAELIQQAYETAQKKLEAVDSKAEEALVLHEMFKINVDFFKKAARNVSIEMRISPTGEITTSKPNHTIPDQKKVDLLVDFLVNDLKAPGLIKAFCDVLHEYLYEKTFKSDLETMPTGTHWHPNSFLSEAQSTHRKTFSTVLQEMQARNAAEDKADTVENKPHVTVYHV